MAVMLDNALTAAQVRPLLPGGRESVVVVTSRRRMSGLVGDGASLHQLNPLSPAAAMELLRRGGGSRVAQEPQAARDVVTLCAHLPMALCLAAAQLAARPRQPVSAMADTLSRGQGPLEALRVEGAAAIRMALDESYRLLPRDVARTYRCMGLLPVTRFDTDMVAAACANSLDGADQELDVLVETNLLEDLGTEGYRFHDLVLAHARQRAEAEETSAARATVLRRFVDWCLFTATAADALLSPRNRGLARTYAHPPAEPVPFRDSHEALTWLDTHRTCLMAAVRHSAAAQWDTACWQLVDAIWPLFLRLRPADLWIEAHEIGLAAARRAGDRRAEGRMLTGGGSGFRNAGRADQAASWYEQALRHAEEDEDPRQQAQALNGLGEAHLLAGRLDQAEDGLSQALLLRETIGYERGVALSRLGIGLVAMARQHYTEATGHLARARAGLLAVGDRYDAARALAFLGQAAACAGDHDDGVRQLRRASAEFKATGSLHGQARTLEMLGQAAQGQGARDEARQCYEQALTIYRSLSPSDAQRLEDLLQAP
ncbi:putative Regulator protein [Streptomyces aurantiacus JA 4570]|uniref:Putative Regulator protein n=1 Tax=Streptomyces aurantiacus JA 4570 TaxID=1286094 RepID=S3ZNP8_9ACTN|nr:putative Regulator protein [Streptomyces aurantiacus JA 4570]